jgi:hypothetical protein
MDEDTRTPADLLAGTIPVELLSPGEAANEEFLAEAERQIRGYGKMVITGIVEIGRNLVEVREHFTEGDGRYTAFVTRRLGWSMMSAQRFVQVHKLFLAQQIVASDLTIAASSLYRIAAPSTPPDVRDQVLVKAASPGGVSRSEVEQMIAEARRAQGPKKRDRTTEEQIAELEAVFGITIDPNNAFFPMMDDNEMAAWRRASRRKGSTSLSRSTIPARS